MTDEPLPGMPEPYTPPQRRVVVDLTARRTTCADCGGPLQVGDRGVCVDCYDVRVYASHLRIRRAGRL